ncbi:PAS domain S-box protein [Lacibacter sp. H407]|uniref:PAS domain S-box protein n=1 Tax=Lacibacter sp. H407 TaxID=3133423 RepID=UPI0030C11D96
MVSIGKQFFPLRRNIVLVFLLAICVLLFFARIIYVVSVESKSTDEMVSTSYRVIEQVGNVRSGIAESEALIREFLLAKDQGMQARLNDIHLFVDRSAITAGAVAKDPIQKQLIWHLRKSLQIKIAEQKKIVEKSGSSFTREQALQLTEADKRSSNELDKKLQQILDGQQLLLQERRHENTKVERRLILIAIAGALLIIMFIAVLLWQLNRDIIRRKKAEQEIRESELKYRRLIEGAGRVTITTDLNGRFEFVAAKCKQLTGYSAAELQGKTFDVLVAENWRKPILEHFEHQYHSNSSGEKVLRFPIITKDGTERWVKLNAEVISNENRPVGFQCMVKDISDEMDAETKLKESEELIKTLLNNTKEGFFMVDRNMNLLVMNQPAKEGIEMRNGTRAEVGMNLLSLIPEDKVEAATENFNRVFNGESVEYEAKYETANGIQWLRISHSPVKENNNTVSGVAVVTSDITAIKLNEEKVQQANQKISAMLASTNEGFYMIAPDHTIVLVNEAGKQIMRLTTNLLCREGDSILKYIKPEREIIFQKIFTNVLNGRVEENELFFETVEGDLWIQNTYFPVRDEANKVIAVCISVKNVTERKLVDQAWEKLREEREEYQFRLQSILDNTPLIMFIKDLEGRYLLINRSFREAFELSDEVVIGKTDFDFEEDDAAIRYREADEQVIAEMVHVQTDETVQMADGEHNLLIVKFPLFDRDNILYGVGGIATDITERVQSREKLVEAKRKAESAEQLQEQFLANMSHEIRTPLNGIIGMTNILQHTPLSEEQDEFVQIIRQSSDNLLMLINDILDLSKIKAGKLSVEQVLFDLQKVLDQAVAPFRLKAKEKGIMLSIVSDRSVPAQLTGDPLRITQILSNLLSNAMKFTEEGSIEIRVCEEAEQQDDGKTNLNIFVTDTGIGIPGEKLEHIFDSFEQAASETSRKYGGTGLGLSITRQLCEIMGGAIAVSSELGKGTTFRVKLPFIISSDVPIVTVAHQEKTIRNEDISGKKILVAEDNEINQKVIMHVLQRVGISTTIVNNGKEAVDLLEAGEEFDLIILDLQMPLMNGFQTATYIRKKLELTIPIIAMTASALRNEKMRCFELGMNEYLTKPFVPADLYTELRRFLLAQPSAGKQTDSNKEEYQGTELYNLSHIYEMDDQEYFCEVLQLFLSTTPLLLNEIHEATLYENWEEVYRKAHKLKSSLGILQMNLMLGVISTIELQAKEQQQVERIPDGLKKATDLFELIRPMIEAELAKVKQVNN